MNQADKNPSRDEGALARHIFPTSGTMFGISVTLGGLVKVIESHTGKSHVDEYLAVVATFFLISGLASYLSIRHMNSPKFAAGCEMLADILFLIGLVSIVVVTLCYAYEVI